MSSAVCVVQGGGGQACANYVSISRAFVRKTLGLINSLNLTSKLSQVGVMLEINLQWKRYYEVFVL